MKKAVDLLLLFMQLLGLGGMALLVFLPGLRGEVLPTLIILLGYGCGSALGIRNLGDIERRREEQRSRQTDGGTGDETRS